MNGNNNRRRNTGGVPPRWMKCPRKSMGYIGQKFLVFKTPLSKDYDEYVPVENKFYPQMITEYVKTSKVIKNAQHIHDIDG